MNQKLSKPALFQYSSMKLQLHLLKEIIAKIRSLEMGGGGEYLYLQLIKTLN